MTLDLLLDELNKDKYLKETIPHTVIAASIDHVASIYIIQESYLSVGKKRKNGYNLRLNQIF